VCSLWQGGFVIALKINRFHPPASGWLPAGEHCTTAILITIVTTSEQSRYSMPELDLLRNQDSSRSVVADKTRNLAITAHDLKLDPAIAFALHDTTWQSVTAA
jgi:hypothetical protein